MFTAEVPPQEAVAADLTEAVAVLQVVEATVRAVQGHQDPPLLPLHPEEGDN